MKYEVTARKM